jgi:hypothetical protein
LLGETAALRPAGGAGGSSPFFLAASRRWPPLAAFAAGGVLSVFKTFLDRSSLSAYI